MKALLVTLALALSLSKAAAVPVTIDFSTLVNFAEGEPFGISGLQPGVTVASGSVTYETSFAAQPNDGTLNSETFDIFQSFGLKLTVGGVTILASNYQVVAVNEVSSGTGDYLQILADTVGGPFTVNGAAFSLPGGVILNLRNSDGTLFESNESLAALPSQTVLGLKLTDVSGALFSPDLSSPSSGVVKFATAVPDTSGTFMLLAVGCLGLAAAGLYCRPVTALS